MTLFGALLGHDPVVLSWDVAARSDTGRLRAHNEDAFAFGVEPAFAILADGMGGYNAGEVASGMAVALLETSLGSALKQAGPTAPGRAIRRALQSGVGHVNSAIHEASRNYAHLQGMGTTLVVAVFGSARVVVGHIGDSRCYRLRAGRLDMLTRDHSLLRQQLDAGRITLREAACSPHRSLVTRAVGVEQRVELELHDHSASPGDLFLLCSDGLSDMVADDDIRALMSENNALPDMAMSLVAAANDAGGRDNISVVLAQAGCPGGALPASR